MRTQLSLVWRDEAGERLLVACSSSFEQPALVGLEVVDPTSEVLERTMTWR